MRKLNILVAGSTGYWNSINKIIIKSQIFKD